MLIENVKPMAQVFCIISCNFILKCNDKQLEQQDEYFSYLNSDCLVFILVFPAEKGNKIFETNKYLLCNINLLSEP